jgi:predicted DNA-binding protein
MARKKAPDYGEVWSARIQGELRTKLREVTKRTGKRPSEIVRKALCDFLKAHGPVAP